MKLTLTLVLSFSFFYSALCCSFVPENFCNTVALYDSLYPSSILVNGVIIGTDDDGVDLEVKQVLKGDETRSIIRIWDGTDFDCNGIFSMAAADFLREGNEVIILLPEITDRENSWDVIGDYRFSDPYIFNPILRVENGNVIGNISGYPWSDDGLISVPYNYFVDKFQTTDNICELEFANLVVRFFHDENEDGIRWHDEPYLPIGAVKLNNDQTYLNSKKGGIAIFALEGTYDITLDRTQLLDWTATGAGSYQVEVSYDSREYVYIGLKPTVDYTNVSLNIVNDRFRCGEEVFFGLEVINEGTLANSGTVWLALDEDFETYSFSILPDYINDDGVVGWDFEDLGPYENLVFPFTIVAPLIEDANGLENIYVLKAYEETEGQVSRASYCHEVELRCSYDPNDKQVFPIREDNLALIDQPLRYTIRFQNTGNDYAKHVVITDTLSESLDRSTFKLIASSHAEQLTVSSDDGYAMKFEFNNIFLPDSITDEPNSHGYLTYTISPKANLALETEIENTAFIYFDFNPAIITNTTKSIMVDAFPSSTVVEINEAPVSCFPNPVTDRLYFSEIVNRVSVYDLAGNLLIAAKNATSLSTDALQQGLHIVHMEQDGKVIHQKIFVSEQ